MNSFVNLLQFWLETEIYASKYCEGAYKHDNKCHYGGECYEIVIVESEE